MTTLPEPQFIERDPEAIRGAVIARVEEKLGRALPPMSTERIMCEELAYREVLVRIAVQEACKQNLWAYARYPMIDYLAQLVGQSRVAGQAAVALFRVTLPAPVGVERVVPRQTVVRTKDGRVAFELLTDVVIAAGDTTGDAIGRALTTGVQGNGYLAGQVTDLVTALGFLCTIANLETTYGGAPAESSDAMRARVPSTLSIVSGAGPSDAYEELARRASPLVVDAVATRPESGVVLTTVLAVNGTPSEEVLAAVLAAQSARDRVPLCDTPTVAGAMPVDYALSLDVVLYAPQSPRTPEMAIAEAQAAAEGFARARGLRLGYQIPDGQLRKAVLAVPEVYDMSVTSELPTVGPLEFARLTDCTVTVVGYAKESLL